MARFLRSQPPKPLIQGINFLIYSAGKPIVTQTLFEESDAPNTQPIATQTLFEESDTPNTQPIATQTLFEESDTPNTQPIVTHTLVEIAFAGAAMTSLACVSSIAMVGAPYSYMFVVTGGDGPFTFAITVGSLPPGLTLDTATGIVSGSPTLAGTYNYTVQVTDSSTLSTLTNTCTIVVSPAGPPAIVYEDPCMIALPLVWATVQDAGGTIRLNNALRYAIRDGSTVYGGYKSPRLTDVGPITRTSSDWLTRAWPAQTANVSWADTDRKVSNLASLISLKQSNLWVYLTSQHNRATNGLPRLLFQGPVYSEASSDMQRTITANDSIGVLYDLFTGNTKVPKRKTGTADFTQMPTSSGNKAVPIVGGYVTDKNNTVGGGADSGTPGYGGVRVRYGSAFGIDIGPITLGGASGRGFLFAGHACKNYDDVFISKTDTSSITMVDGVWGFGKIPASEYGVKVYVPGQAGFPFYFDINGNRYSIVVVTDPTYITNLTTNGYRLRANIQGAETVGDGTGTLMEDVGVLAEWLINSWLIGNYTSGAWLTSPQFELFPGGGVFLNRVNHDSFTRASLVASAILPGGFKGAFIIGAESGGGSVQITTNLNPSIGQKGSDEILKDALFSWNMMLRWNQFNQIEVVMLDRRRSYMIGTKPTVKWQHDILSTPRFATKTQEKWFFNEHGVFYEPVYGIQGAPSDLFSPWYSGRFQENATSQTEYGLVTRNIGLPFVFDHATAQAVGQQVLDFSSQPRRVATYAMSLCGLANDVLDGVPVSHYTGDGVNGWSNRALWILNQRINPVACTIELDAVDIDDLLS